MEKVEILPLENLNRRDRHREDETIENISEKEQTIPALETEDLDVLDVNGRKVNYFPSHFFKEAEMRMWNRLTLAAGIVLVPILVAANLAEAQQKKKAQQPQQQQQQAKGPMLQDEDLANLLITDLKKEIALAQFAQDQAQSEEVKQFAETLATDHAEIVRQLQQHTQGQQGAQQQQPGQQQQQQRGQLQQQQQKRQQQQQKKAQQPQQQQQQAGQGVGALQLAQAVADQNLTSAIRELEEKPQEEFDQAWVGLEVVAHSRIHDTMQVFQKHASSSEFKQTLQQGSQKVEEHLNKAKELHDQLKQQQQQ